MSRCQEGADVVVAHGDILRQIVDGDNSRRVSKGMKQADGRNGVMPRSRYSPLKERYSRSWQRKSRNRNLRQLIPPVEKGSKIIAVMTLFDFDKGAINKGVSGI